MMLAGLAAMVLGTMLARGRDIFDFTNDVFGSFVAVTGDAHQAKVAQDIFRQEIRYERSLQIREDIRDVNKMMLDSVQTHLFVGSIILGVCFAMFIEGYPPSGTSRLLSDFWIVFCCWSATFTLISLWLALCFQAQISHCARERLLRKHRFQMPDDQVVGKMGGGSLVNQIAIFHDRVLELVNRTIRAAPDEQEEEAVTRRKKRVRKSSLKVQVEGKDGRSLDAVPVHKGMHAWLYKSGDTLALPTILDMPTFLVGETLIRSRWFCHGGAPLSFRVRGEATLYIAAQCPPRDSRSSKEGITTALRLNGIVPEWPVDQLPFVTEGYHEAWRGPSGNGEFRRVNGFSVFVDKAAIEMPIYKIVLQSPADVGDGMVDVQVDWRFLSGCEALLLMLRRGHVHCKEEDWPIVEFNEEIKQVMPLRDYSGLYLRHGVSCLLLSALFTCTARLWVEEHRVLWWFESILLVLALAPALLAIVFIPIHQTGERITQTIQSANMTMVQGSVSKILTRSKPLRSRSRSDELKGMQSDDLASMDSFKVFGDLSMSIGEAQGEMFGNGNGNGNGCQSIAPAELATEMPLAGAGVEGGGRPAESSSKWRTSPRREWAPARGSPRAWLRQDLSSSPRASRNRSSSSQREDSGATPRPRPSSQTQAPLHGMFPPLSVEAVGGACGQALEKLGEGMSRLPELSTGCTTMELGPCREVVRPLGCDKPPSRARSPRSRSPPRAVAAAHDQSVTHCPHDQSVSHRSNDQNSHRSSDQSIAALLSPVTGHRSLDEGLVEPAPSQMNEDEHVVQQEPGLHSKEALSQLMQRMPEVIRPLDPDKPLMIEGAAAKSLRRTLRKFKIWTTFLRVCFGLSVVSAASTPYLWVEMLQEALSPAPSPAPPLASPSPAGATLIAAALTQLPWLELEVAWPPFFHPTAAALGSVAVGAEQREVLWLAADGVLRAFVAGAGSSALSPGPALLLPLLARGLGIVAGRLAAVGTSALAEVDLSSLPLPAQGVSPGVVASPARLLDAVALTTVRPPRSLPSGVAGDTADVMAAAVLPGLDVVAVASADDPAAASSVVGAPSSTRTTVHLCGAGANASVVGPLHVLGRLGPLEGAVRALYACGNGTCATEAVLWAAVNGGLAAVGLDSGTVLASFAAPRVAARGAHALLRGTVASASREAGVVVALTGNATHLLAVVAADGRRPAVFSTPIPALPAEGGPLVEL